MATYLVQVGQVWDAMVPYGEIDDAKRRPVVILGWAGLKDKRGDPHILVVPSSTFGGDPSKARSSDLSLRDWKAAGLSAASFIQCARLWSLHPDAFDFQASLKGTLDGADLQAVMAEVSKFFTVSGFVGV